MKATLDHVYRIEGLAFPIAWPTPGNRTFIRERADLHTVVDGILSRRRASGCPVHDLLDSLMQARDADGSGDFDDAWLRDEVVTLMLAGHKTTANALTWSWHLLSLQRKSSARFMTRRARCSTGARRLSTSWSACRTRVKSRRRRCGSIRRSGRWSIRMGRRAPMRGNPFPAR